MHGVSDDFNPTLENLAELYHPDDRAKLREATADAISEGKPYDLEVRMIAREDNQKWFRTIAKNGRWRGRSCPRNGL